MSYKKSAGGFILALLLLFSFPSLLFAQSYGYSQESSFKESYSSIPTEVIKGNNFTVVLKFENVVNPEVQAEDYVLTKCMIQSGFADGRNAGEPVVDLVSGYAVDSDGVKHTLLKTGTATMPIMSFDVSSATSILIKENSSGSATFVLSTSKDIIKETDKIYLNISCGYKGITTEMETGPGVASNPPYINIVPAVVDDSTKNTNTTDNTNTEETSKEEEKAKIAEVTLPSDFTKEGSATTDLSSLTTENAKSVSNFVLENKDVGKIEFLENVDLSEEATATKFASLSDYVSIETGKVRIDSSGLSVLNKKAKITMYGLSFLEGSNVTILIDGDHVEGIISDVEYKEGTLSFEVTGFSTYEVSPTVVLDYSESTFDDFVILKGTIDDLSSVITIDGEEIQYDENGLFEIEYELEYGTNTFELVAENVNGAKYEETFSIIRNMTSEVYREVWTEQMVFFVLGGSLLASFGVGIGVFLLGKKLIKKIRIKKENKKILPVQEEKEMVNEMKEEVDEKLDDVGVE